MSKTSRPIGPPDLSTFDLETAKLYGLALCPALSPVELRRGLRALTRARTLTATDKAVTAGYLAWSAAPHRPPTAGQLAVSLNLGVNTCRAAVHRLLDLGVLRRMALPTDGEPRGLWVALDLDALDRQATGTPPAKGRRGGPRGVTRQGKSAGADLFLTNPLALVLVLANISLMPRLATFNGISIWVYADDHNPPHVHVQYAEYGALLVIATSEVLTGDLPGKVRKQAVRWLDENRAAAQAAWDEMNP